MCGIAGVWHFDGSPVSKELIKKMTDVIAHRGPDGEGQYVDGALGLGNRRLAIIDLSPAGAQPMASDSGDLVITYNGEIYNYRELRSELVGQGDRFRSQSDTEVIIKSYSKWGAKCVERFNGMFGLALWDRRNKTLFLARDRFGVKPLYYYFDKKILIFGSEIKAILQHPAVSPKLSYPALSEYFSFQNIFSDLTLFEGICLLPAGCTLTIRLDRDEPVAQQERYWDFHFCATQEKITAEECAEEVQRLFEQAVERQLVSDVPVGAYLSGGMDTGSITSVAARKIRRIHTFTAGFDLSSASGLELVFDEREASEILSNLFKTEHYEMVLHAGDMEEVLPELVWHLEDLRVGQSYPNYYVARLAGKFVKVILSGSGGDELFAGYPWRYYRGLQAKNSEEYYQAYYDYWQRLIPDRDRPSFFNSSTHSLVRDHQPLEAFRRVFSQNHMPLETVEDVVNASLYFEAKTFLQGLFVVEDKLNMAHSLESRVPFLDNDLVDFAMKIPPRFKLRDLEKSQAMDENELGKFKLKQTGDGKVILRQAMSKLVPLETLTRAKQGFSAPDASWFRGESIDYVQKLLRDPKAQIYNYFNPTYIAKILDEHITGQINHRLLIWSLLCFEWWCRRFLR